MDDKAAVTWKKSRRIRKGHHKDSIPATIQPTAQTGKTFVFIVMTMSTAEECWEIISQKNVSQLICLSSAIQQALPHSFRD
jgi:hypothetical protein